MLVVLLLSLAILQSTRLNLQMLSDCEDRAGKQETGTADRTEATTAEPTNEEADCSILSGEY